MNQMTVARRLSCKVVPVALLVAGVIGIGCNNSGYGQYAQVSGIVRQANGEPLPGGIITFHDAQKDTVQGRAVIREDGSYQIKLPLGLVMVSVDNAVLKGSGIPRFMAKMPAKIQEQMQEQRQESENRTRTSLGPMPTGTWVSIPERYKSSKLSGLSLDVLKSDNLSFDVTLEK